MVCLRKAYDCFPFRRIKRSSYKSIAFNAFLILTLLFSAGAGYAAEGEASENEEFIRWVDFRVPCEAMKKAISLDIDSQSKEVKLHFIPMLAYLAAKNGNNF